MNVNASYFGVARKFAAQISLSAVLAAVAVLAGSSQASTTPADTRQQFLNKLALAAEERARHSVRYDPAYVRIPYPGGDVPAGTGVCTDEVIRSFRALGIDLQKEVHEDMQKSSSQYPPHGRVPANRLDANIDHRRVPNLMVFFSRQGESLSITRRATDYFPGEIVTWDLGGNIPHIGLVVTRKSSASGRYMILHNNGRGPKIEDVLFEWKITGHYRYFGSGSR